MDKKEKVKTYIYAIVSVLSFILVSVGSTYAFFAASIIGNEEGGEVNLKTAEVFAVFEAKNEINDSAILPGFSDNLVFTIVNTSPTENTFGNYTLFWNIIKNEVDSDNFVYTLSATSYKGNQNVPLSNTNSVVTVATPTRIPTASTSIGTGTINTGVTHRYTLTVKFLDNGQNQNELQGKSFQGQIVAKGDPNV